MKRFDAVSGGVQLDGSFAQHASSCDRCRAVDLDKPAMLAALCLEGSVLWKRDNAQPIAREPAPHNPNHVSVAAAKKLMRYK